jgi:hypothetical protein
LLDEAEKLSQLLEQVYQEQSRRNENEERPDYGPQVESDIEPTPQARRLNLVHMSDERLAEYAYQVYLEWKETRGSLLDVPKSAGGPGLDIFHEPRRKRNKERLRDALSDVDDGDLRAIANGEKRPPEGLRHAVARLMDVGCGPDDHTEQAREEAAAERRRRGGPQRAATDGGEVDLGTPPAVSRSTTARQSNPGVDTLVAVAVGLGLLVVLDS